MTQKHFFEEEISKMSPDIRRIGELALINVPEQFWTASAASTAKYHPIEDLGVGGLARHTRNVYYLVTQELARKPIPEIQQEMLKLAAILHDSCKQGLRWESKYTVFEHPLLPRQLLSQNELHPHEWELWMQITEIISTHMGAVSNWRSIRAYDLPRVKDIVDAFRAFGYNISDRIVSASACDQTATLQLPPPVSNLQWMLHDADHVASRKEISFASLYPEEKPCWENISRPDTSDSKEFVPATDKQKNALLSMVKQIPPSMADEFSWITDIEKVSKSKASWAIGRLKMILS